MSNQILSSKVSSSKKLPTKISSTEGLSAGIVNLLGTFVCLGQYPVWLIRPKTNWARKAALLASRARGNLRMKSAESLLGSPLTVCAVCWQWWHRQKRAVYATGRILLGLFCHCQSSRPASFPLMAFARTAVDGAFLLPLLLLLSYLSLCWFLTVVSNLG